MEKLTREQVQKYMAMEGKVVGVAFQGERDYLLRFYGEEGLRKVEERARELGVEIPHETATAASWYPLGISYTSVSLIKETFDLSPEQVREWGRFLAKSSLVLKILMKYMVSLKKLAEKIPYYWKKQYTVGSVEIIKLDEEAKEFVLRVGDIKFPGPFYLRLLEGFGAQMIEFIVGKGNVTESRFTDEGDYYELTIRWK